MQIRPWDDCSCTAVCGVMSRFVYMSDVQVMQSVIDTVNILANTSVSAATAMIEHMFLVTYYVTGILESFQCHILHLTFSSVFLMIHCLALRHLHHQFYCTKRNQCLTKCTLVVHSYFIWMHSSARVQDLEGGYCVLFGIFSVLVVCDGYFCHHGLYCSTGCCISL